MINRREFISLVAGSMLVAASDPVLLRNGLPLTRPPADLPIQPPAEPLPWAGLSLVSLPRALIVGRTYWVVIDDVDSPFGVPHGFAQQFVANAPTLLTGISLRGLPQKLVPSLTNVRIYADTSTP